MNMFLHFSVSRVHSLLGLLIQLVAVFATLDKIFQNIGLVLVQVISFRRIGTLRSPTDPGWMSSSCLDLCLATNLFDGHIHQDPSLCPLGSLHISHRFQTLIGQEIPHRVDDELVLTIFIDHFSRLHNMGMPTKDDISSPRNHLMIELFLLFCRLQLVLNSHLGHDNGDIGLLLRLLDLRLHPLFIQIRQDICLLLWSKGRFHPIKPISVG